MNPREVAVAAAELVELGLLANPEDPQCQEAHQVSEQVRREPPRSPATLVGKVSGHRLGPGRERPPLPGAGQDPDPLSPGQQVPDERGADLAPAADHQNHALAAVPFLSSGGYVLNYASQDNAGSQQATQTRWIFVAQSIGVACATTPVPVSSLPPTGTVTVKGSLTIGNSTIPFSFSFTYPSRQA